MTGNRIVVKARISDNNSAVAGATMTWTVDGGAPQSAGGVKASGFEYEFTVPEGQLLSPCVVAWEVAATDGYTVTRRTGSCTVGRVTQGAGSGTVSVVDGNPYDGSTRLVLTQNSLGSAGAGAVVTVEQVASPGAGVAAAYRVGASAGSLAEPVEMAMLYLDLDNNGAEDVTNAGAGSLVLCWYNEAAARWETVGGVVNTAVHEVRARIPRLGLYGLLAAAPQPSERLTDRSFLTPQNPAVSFREDVEDVTVFSVGGSPVVSLRQELGSRIIWNGRSNDGSLVESGLYLCRANLKNNQGSTFVTVVMAK
jgi:hypothetical protein